MRMWFLQWILLVHAFEDKKSPCKTEKGIIPDQFLWDTEVLAG